MLPSIELEHWIGDKLYETITLERKSAFILGNCSHLANIILDNDSVADQNSALVIDKNKGLMIVDLEPEFKTKLNKTELTKLVPYPVSKGDSLIFAKMPGTYKVT
jgi:hypothetical protein